MDFSGISEFLKTRVLPLWEEAVLLETLKKCFIFFYSAGIQKECMICDLYQNTIFEFVVAKLQSEKMYSATELSGVLAIMLLL